MSIYLQLRSLKTNIVYGDAQAWLSNFLSHQSCLLSSILFEDPFTRS